MLGWARSVTLELFLVTHEGDDFMFQLSSYAPVSVKKRYFYNGQNGCKRERTLQNFGKVSKDCVFDQMLSG